MAIEDTSTEQITAPALRVLSGLTPLFITLVIYGSWLPFEVQAGLSFETGPALLGGLVCSAPRFGDVMTNIVVYIPIGLFLAMRLSFVDVSSTWRSIYVVTVAFLVSSFAETGQVVLVGRVACYTDMVFNGIGTIIGLAFAPIATRLSLVLSDHLKLALALRPMRALFWIVIILVVTAKLVPFDFAIWPEDWERSLAFARWSPFDPAVLPSANLLEDMVEIAGSFFAFVLLGMAGALALREVGELRSVCVTNTIAKLAFVAVGIELAQLLLVSHNCDMADALTYLWGAIVGAILGATVIDRQVRKSTPSSQTNPVGKMLLMTALVVQVALIAGYAYPASGEWVWPTVESVQWLPFYAQFQGPFAQGVAQVVSSLMWYVTLAVIVSAMLPTRRWAYNFGISAFLTVSVVTITEAVQAFNVTRYADVTEPLLALFAALAATSAYHWILQYRKMATAEVIAETV